MLLLSRRTASSSSSSSNAPNSNSSTSRARRCSSDVILVCPLGTETGYFGSPEVAFRPVTVYTQIRYNMTVMSLTDRGKLTEIHHKCQAEDNQTVRHMIHISRYQQKDLFLIRTHEK